MTVSWSRLLLTAAVVYRLLLTAASLPAQAPADYSKAEAFVRQGQWDQGIALLKQLLETEPNNLKARNLMGIALTGRGDVAAADQEFKHALQIDPHFYPALKNLAINETGTKDFVAAQKHLTEAVALAPNDPVIHAYLGEIAYTRHEYRTAAGHWEKSGELKKDPAVAAKLVECYLETNQQERGVDTLRTLNPEKLIPRTQFALGLALARHELYRQATPYFEAVGAKYPDSYDAAFNLALCYVQTKEFAKAIGVLKAAEDRAHKTAELDNLLAEAYQGNNQTQDAINALREAAQLDPSDESNYVDLATLCTNNEAYDLGLEVIKVGLHYHPQSDRLIFQRGVIEAMMNHFDLADQDFQLASSLAPEKNLSYVALGVSYMQRGSLPEAIRTLRQRTKEKPNDYTLQYLLGEALLRSGAAPGDATFAEAKAALEKSVKLNAKFPASQIDLGKIYLKENRLDDAQQHLERARALNPEEKTAYSQLAIVYRKQGNAEQASAMLATLNRLNDEERQGNSRQRLRLVKDSAASSE